MKKLKIILTALCLSSSFVICSQETGITGHNIFKSIKIYYEDSLTNKNKKTTRELIMIGEEEYFSKPSKFNIEVELYEIKNGKIQIFIEEFFSQRHKELPLNYGAGISDSTWVLHEVVYDDIAGNKDKIIVKDVNYKTAYFYDSELFVKSGFRITALFIPKDRNKRFEMIKQEFYY